MITRTNAFVSNGKTFATLEEAQQAALDDLFSKHATDPASLTVLKYRDEIIDILTTTKTSKPSARKVNGGTKKRIGRKTAEEQPENPQPL